MKHFLSADIVNEIFFILNVEYLLFPYAFLYPFHLPFVIIWCDRTALLHHGKDTHSSAIFYSQRWCNSLLHFLLCLLLRLLLFCILQEFLIYFIFRCVLSSCCLCALLIFLRFSHFPWNFLHFFSGRFCKASIRNAIYVHTNEIYLGETFYFKFISLGLFK